LLYGACLFSLQVGSRWFWPLGSLFFGFQTPGPPPCSKDPFTSPTRSRWSPFLDRLGRFLPSLRLHSPAIKAPWELLFRSSPAGPLSCGTTVKGEIPFSSSSTGNLTFLPPPPRFLPSYISIFPPVVVVETRPETVPSVFLSLLRMSCLRLQGQASTPQLSAFATVSRRTHLDVPLGFIAGHYPVPEPCCTLFPLFSWASSSASGLFSGLPPIFLQGQAAAPPLSSKSVSPPLTSFHAALLCPAQTYDARPFHPAPSTWIFPLPKFGILRSFLMC